ncbi:MAG TPA: hypothetical protein VFN35_11480 [Ktedonobacteraceae bacterium]|nr:hypothetical protein [Ktedonobacteraceae bacterium]
MAKRKTSQGRTTTRRSTQKQQDKSVTRQFSAIVGGTLIGIALLWAVWLLLRQTNPAMNSLVFPMPGPLSQNATSSPSNPLLAAGVTLTTPSTGQEPALTRQQALLLASQLEPTAAAQAGAVDAQYTLFSYTNAKTSTTFRDAQAWLVHYSKVPEPRPDASADPRAASTQHDLYVFLDANSGATLLKIWL